MVERIPINSSPGQINRSHVRPGWGATILHKENREADHISSARSMIQPSKRLQEFERRYTRTTVAQLTFVDALAIFQALWVEASELNPDFPGHWRSDIEPDLAIARVLNGLPPSP